MDNESTIRFDSNTDQARREAEKLATYLWENYIEPYDHEQVFFIGIGNAFHGVVKLLTDKGLHQSSFSLTLILRLTHLQKMHTKELVALWLLLPTTPFGRFTALTTPIFRGGISTIQSSLYPIRTAYGVATERPRNGTASCRNRQRNNFTT